jgi:hypothetical protein
MHGSFAVLAKLLLNAVATTLFIREAPPRDGRNVDRRARLQTQPSLIPLLRMKFFA